jgi:hypothetical protein
MMKNQIKFVVAIAVGVTMASGTSISEAGRPYGMFSSRTSRPSQNYSTANRSPSNHAAAPSYAAGLLQSPERLEKIFGPSILVVGEQQGSNSVAKQP